MEHDVHAQQRIVVRERTPQETTDASELVVRTQTGNSYLEEQGMTNEEVMQMLTDMGLHDGGIENWIPDNAWYLLANKVQEKEREACAKLVDCWEAREGEHADAIRARGQV